MPYCHQKNVFIASKSYLKPQKKYDEVWSMRLFFSLLYLFHFFFFPESTGKCLPLSVSPILHR